ncbi:xanthine dehydrogenase family protein molybdopterin-binding subunit [Haladaptatus halobius]|uniref:xanthine dehydrogenase family protein molybdopterin-binding subunit n=1 Tax=Haladaptatus halobius TaxID=2884875 RepID=UPI001D0B8DCA|nr:molybdopterin cofactor-binding domain-containing protein [Haladaptatus halobius]
MAESEIETGQGIDSEAIEAHAEGETEVGKSVQKVDGHGLVTGRARYTDDVPTEHALEVCVLRSPYAHARIASIDTSTAEEVDGVHAIITHKDVPKRRFTRTGFPYPQPAPFDEFIINEKVRFVGDPVAAVAAETETAAETAVEKIDVEYDVLEHVLDPAEAMQDDAPVIHDQNDYENAQRNADIEHNIVCETRHEEGNAEAGFEEADTIVEGVYETQIVQQAPMEMNTTIAWIDDRERLVLRTSTQISHITRNTIARALGMNRKDVRVIKPRVGGGFGVKQDILPSQLIAAALALETGETIRIENSRQEDLHVAQTRHAQTLSVKTGVKDDGTITALHFDITSNTGAYGCHAYTVLSNAGHEPMSIYPCENRLFTGRTVYTNVTPAGAMRGYGAVQGSFGLESHIDDVAEAIDMDPTELRRRNLVQEGDEGFEPGYSQSAGALESVGVGECLEKVCDAVDWDNYPEQDVDERYKRGRGVALTMHKSGVASSEFSGAEITLEDDGTCTLMVGVGDAGQGAETTMAQIAAGVLGLETHEIHVKADDTDATPWDNGAYASSTTYVSGNATEKAALDLAEKIRLVATRWLDGDPTSFELAEGTIKAPDGEELALTEFAERAFVGIDGPKRRLKGYGEHFTPISPKPFAAQAAEVEVDTETGEFEALSLISAADCGYAINPENARGQVIGGAVMGLGQALSEELTFDEDGTPQVDGLKNYGVLRSTDIPERVESILVESYEPTGPFGAKSVGEVTNMGPPAAVANAIKDAVGVRISDLPITKAKVEAGLKESKDY